jgi:hypothetical protein
VRLWFEVWRWFFVKGFFMYGVFGVEKFDIMVLGLKVVKSTHNFWTFQYAITGKFRISIYFYASF